MIPEALFDSLAEPVLVFDFGGQLRYANRAALRQLPVRAGMALVDLRDGFDAPTWRWLHGVITQSANRPLHVQPPPAPRSVDGRLAPVLSRVGERHWALCLPLDAARARDPVQVMQIADGPLRQVHAMLWGSPFPAMLQDEGFRILDVNPAYLTLTGHSRERLLGRDPLELQPEVEHAQTLADRDRLVQDPQHPDVPALMEQRLVDSQGQTRWVRAARYVTLTQDGRRLLMTLMHETTAEHAAREQAERFSRELDQWFDLSPLGMALFDVSGLVLRANQAFERLTGAVLVDLHDASAEVKALLQWGDDGLTVALDPGGAWLSSEAAVSSADGASHWVRAMLRCHESRGGPRRIMCMLEDRTAEEERDLAQLQLGALVDTAGVGLSTLRGPGLSRSVAGEGGEAAAEGRGALLAGVRRELVLPASLPEFERLQRALKLGERCEVRYAIDHPELGLRWLVTRVEPGRLASGRPSTSVVTLDVTEQQLAQERAEQLLVELSTILESSPAGIASMRGYTLMHCNRRFERMLRLPPGGAIGSDIRAVLATRTNGPLAPSPVHGVAAPGGDGAPGSGRAEPLSLGDVGAGGGADGETLFEAELEVPEDDGRASHWYALSIRRTGPVGEASQAIAVLSEITRLKTQQAQLESLARDRAQMAQVLGQQADRTRAVLDSVLVGIVTVNDQGLISWLNRSARRMFGGDLSDFLGQPMQTVATDDELHPFRRSLDLFGELRDGEAAMFECRVQGRDGRVFWVVGNTVNTLSAHGQRELTYALMDIEQRRQAEGRVAQARASLQRIIEAAPMAITLCDAASLAVLQINRAAAAQVGLSAEAAVGRSPEQL
ncbi:MAG: PAS domain S-box protein, partial [Leptothrix sp. (in: b-proteobacteria)]